MLHSRFLSTLHATCVGVLVLGGSATAQSADPHSTVSEIPLPGGLKAALAAIGDNASPDRTQFLLEFIRRTYDTPLNPKGDSRGGTLRSLLAVLDGPADLTGLRATDTVPLPLSPRIWIDAVFEGRATPETLVSAILRSRGSALLYYGLLSLDNGTRAWIAGQPDLLRDLASRHPAGFVAAAPGLRMSPAGLSLPGGALAEPAWRALAGRGPTDPADFVRALVESDDGGLAYFFGAIATLTPSQIRVTLNLGASDVATRVESARRMYAVFQRVGAGHSIEHRAFLRSTYDPALLVADLKANTNGEPEVPGTRAFWSAVFKQGDDVQANPGRERAPTLPGGDGPADFPWLCEQVFSGDSGAQRSRYMMVLFASRRLGGITSETARDGVDAARAAGAYPALIAGLERAGIADIGTFARAARRAAALARIDDEGRATRALAQFQGALALISRAASRRSLTPESLSSLVSALSAIDLSERGDYEGRLVRWLDAWIEVHLRDHRKPAPNPAAIPEQPGVDVYESAAGPLEQGALRILAGPALPQPRFVDWEGTRYRLDFSWAEATRLTRALGESPRPSLSSARAVLLVADTLDAAGLTREGLQEQADALARVARGNGADEAADEVLDRHQDASAALQRAARTGDVRGGARLAPELRLLADDLLGRGLMDLAYAVALGERDGVSLSAPDAASRHEFGLRTPVVGRAASWRLPSTGTDAAQRWHVAGSLLGLDVALARFSLVGLSSRPPPRKPSLNDNDRRVFIEAVALVEPAALTDADRDSIVAAIRRGRAKLEVLRTPDDAVALAGDIGLSAPRGTLLAWMVTHEPGRVAFFLSPGELLRLGRENARVGALDAWGAPGGARLGCLCLHVVEGRPWETFAGRWSGMMASAFSDLNFRLAELLAELHMPAPLLGPVLRSATLDFVNTAGSRDQDDRRGLVEFVQALRSDRMEQYLALLTTDGPLVPIGEAPKARVPGTVGAAGQLERSPR